MITKLPSISTRKAFAVNLTKIFRTKSKKQQDEKPIEEKTQLHIKDAYDYQGRSFLHIPQDVGINLKGN